MKKFIFYIAVLLGVNACLSPDSPECRKVIGEKGGVNKKLSNYVHNEEKVRFSAEVIKLNEQAILLINERNETSYLKAIKILDKAIGLDTTYHMAYAHKADVLSKLGKYYEAIDLYKHIVENIKPDYLEIYPALGIHYEKIGKDSIAREFYEKAIHKYSERINKNGGIIDMVNRAHIIYILDKEKGLKEIDSLIKIYPTHMELQMYKEYMFLGYDHHKVLGDL
jgi:tetratricopeptide (TPR) repeat protein